METPRPKPVGAQYRTHSLRRRLRQAGQPPGIQQEEMKRPQPGIRLRRDSRSGRESPRLLSFRARFSFPCWPDRDGGLAALAPLRGAKASAAAAQSNQGPKRQPGTAANLVAGQAAGPLGKPGASQNCPQLYQGESGGLEPSTKPVAGQAAATLHSLSP